jgi:hypothetical protein
MRGPQALPAPQLVDPVAALAYGDPVHGQSLPWLAALLEYSRRPIGRVFQTSSQFPVLEHSCQTVNNGGLSKRPFQVDRFLPRQRSLLLRLALQQRRVFASISIWNDGHPFTHGGPGLSLV